MGWNAIMELRHACMIRTVPTLFNARSNPWDGTDNGTTTFMFDSPNTWNVICTAPRDWRIHARTRFGSWSDRARVVEWCVSRFKKISLLFWNVISCGGRRIWRCCRVNPVALRNFQPFSEKFLWYCGAWFFVAGNCSLLMILDGDSRCSAYNANDVPAVFHKILCFVSWQAQYLVILDGVSCCSVQCKMTPMPFSTQKPLLVQSHFSWQAQYLGMLEESWLLFALTTRICIEKCTILRSGSVWILPNIAPATKSDSWIHPILQLPWKLNMQLEFSFIKYCACHEKTLWTAPNIAPATKTYDWMCNLNATSSNIAPAPRSNRWISPNTGLATKNANGTAPNIAPATKTECATRVQLHQILRMPRKVY